MSLRFHGGWSNLKFFKSGTEIKSKTDLKIADLKKKQEERQERIRAISTAKGLDITSLLTNLESFQRGMSSDAFTMNVGEMEQLKAEASSLKDERSTLEQLEVVSRNVVPSESYQLTFEQLEYLNF